MSFATPSSGSRSRRSRSRSPRPSSCGSGIWPLVDPVGIDHDPALGRLPEDLGQPGDRQPPRSDDIGQDLPRSNGGQLIHVADEQQALHARGIALVSAFMSGTSTIEVSSTTSRSQSSGFSSLREKPPCFGSISSRRWMVLASIPVCSVMRLAARPVGAARSDPRRLSQRGCEGSSRACWSCPHQDRPSSPRQWRTARARTASRWEAERVLPVRPSTHGRALSRSMAGQGGLPSARAISRSAMARSAACRPFQEDAGLCARPCR